MISNMYTTTNLSEVYTGTDMNAENTYLKVEMLDGTSQLIKITKEQAIGLGIEVTEPAIITTTPNEVIHIPNVDICVNQNNFPIKIDTATRPDVKTKYNYRVIHPEDLNLRPSNVMPPLVSLPRGRPKKRSAEELVEKPVLPLKIIKPTRTRSGRITRPPIHMEKDFEKIVINEDKNPISEHNELCTTEFKPLKTNNFYGNKQEEVPLVIVKKKKKIPSQYRCSMCKKAYLGRNRMVQHLKTHPDHGNVSQLNMENCEAWSCLIETAMKAKEGQKGNKFCKEILNLIKNARVLVKYFFKPVTSQKSEYYVDTILSSILNVKEGNYRFNENELCKDISIFSFLELFDDSFPEHIIKTKEPQVQLKQEDCHNILSLGDELDCNKKLNGNETYVQNSNSFQSLEYQKENDKNVFEKDTNSHSTVNLHFGSEFMDVIKEPEKIVKQEFENIYNKEIDKNTERKTDSFEAIMKVIDEKNASTSAKNFRIYNESNSEVNNQSLDIIVIDKNVNTDFNNFFDCRKSYIESKTLNTDSQFVIEKTVETYNQDLLLIENKSEKNINYNNFIERNNADKQSKQVDIFRNTINNILSLGASDENMINVLASDNHKNVGGKVSAESTLIQDEKALCNDMKHNDFIMLDEDEKGDKNNGKKADDFDLHKLHLLSEHISDELILPDSGHVTSILDTSTSSDDIMNVDQFVNESFKKLTEADLPNTSLSLDLPTMDCFNFHTN